VKEEVKVEVARGLRYAAFFMFLKKLFQFTKSIDIGKGTECFLVMKIGPLTGKNEKS
jgi:hypothetical protein